VRIAVAIVCAALIVVAVAAGPAAAAPGSNSDAAQACQHDGWKTMTDPATGVAFKNQGDCVSAGAHRGPASLVVAPTVSADGHEWGVVTGSGLLPGSSWSFSATSGSGFGITVSTFVAADGTINFGSILSCGSGYHTVSATATTASGQAITSNTIDTSPCG
jgi:hypothetical protein